MPPLVRRRAAYLLREDIVGEEDHTGGVGDEVGDGFHDIPSKHVPAHTQTSMHEQQTTAALHPDLEIYKHAHTNSHAHKRLCVCPYPKLLPCEVSQKSSLERQISKPRPPQDGRFGVCLLSHLEFHLHTEKNVVLFFHCRR